MVMNRRRLIFSLGVFTLIAQCSIYIFVQPTKPFHVSLASKIKAARINGSRGAFHLREDNYEPIDDEIVQDRPRIRVHDAKIERMIDKIIRADSDFFPDWYWTATMETLVKTLGKRRRESGAFVLGSAENQTRGNAHEGWGNLDRIMRQYSLYDPDDPVFKELIHRMAHSDIEMIRANDVGWYLKVDVKLKGGGWAVLKPMRLPPFLERKSKYARHHNEIAVFHLDRLLGYYRVPPTVGRIVNLQTELYPMLPDGIRNTFFINEDGRTCFYGDCYQCNKNRTYCGSPTTAEVSLMYYLPDMGLRKDLGNLWLMESNYHNPDGISESPLCRKVRAELLTNTRLEFEVLDVRYFDALIDNYDRHHYTVYTQFKKHTIPFLYDNSESFRVLNIDGLVDKTVSRGNHCCLMKKTTFLKYLKMFLGPAHLSDLMTESLRADPFNPILSDENLQALNRRVNRTLFFIYECLNHAHHTDYVIVDDDK